MKTTLLFLSVFLSANLFSQNVYIPDANFKAYLVGDSDINTNGDTEIQVSEATAFDGSINCPYENISDLKGIEAFTSLNYLNCAANNLTILDVSQNVSLTRLTCYENNLTSLDVSQNLLLEKLYCEQNAITSLDLSQNGELWVLRCWSNQLTCLNLQNGNNNEINDQDFRISNNPNLTCVQVDDATWSTANWTYFDPQTSFSENCNYPSDCFTSSLTELTTSKNLIQILDMMGRETTFKPNTPLIYVYDDGSTEKVFSVEY